MKFNWSFSISVLALIVLPHVAHAGVEEDMAKAQDSLNMQDLDDAAKKFKVIAEQNYLPAQVALGELFRAAEDYDTALGWFMMAAYQGDAAGEFDLGKMYYEGQAVEQNSRKALYWIKQAADKNYLPAVDMMLFGYQKGQLGLAVDPKQAKEWDLKSRALKVAQAKEYQEKLEKYNKEKKVLMEATLRQSLERKAAAEKAEKEAIAKKVDAADDATTVQSADKVSPAQTK